MSIESYQAWRANQSESVRRAIDLVFDETGRQKAEMYIGISYLLDQCNTYEEFYEMYAEFTGYDYNRPAASFSDLAISLSDRDIKNEALMYYHIYLSGMIRLRNDVTNQEKIDVRNEEKEK